MPQIIVTAGNAGHEHETSVTLRERVNESDFESERFAVNLLERLGWAVADATEAEREEPAQPRAERTRPDRTRSERRRPITGSRRDAESERQLEPVGSA